MAPTATVAHPAPPVVAPGYRRIVRLATPLALANAFALSAQWLMVVVIGRFGADALYIRSLYLPVSYILSAFQIGIDVSALVAVARVADREAVARTVRAMLAAGMLAMTGIAVLVAACAGPLGDLLGADAAAGRRFVPFVALMCLVAVADIPCMVLTAALRGSGRPGQASVVVAVVMAVQVAGLVAFGGPLGLGLLGLPAAIGVALVVGIALDLVFLHRAGLLAGTAHRPAGGDPGGFRRAVATLGRVGVPVGGTFVVLFLANSATLRVLDPFGKAAVSGYGIANATQIVVVVPAIGLGTAVAILLNQHRGAAVAVIVRRGAVLAATLYATLGALVFLAARPVARLASPDADVGRVAGTYLRVVGPTLACVGTMLVALTVLEQTGSGFVALAFNVGYFGLSIGTGAVLAHRSGAYGTFFDTIAVANALALVAVVPVAAHRIRRLAGG